MAAGSSIVFGREKRLWAFFEKAMQRKGQHTRHTVYGPTICHAATNPVSTQPALWMPQALYDILIVPTGIGSGVANVWIATVTNLTTTYTWQCIAGPSVGTAVTQ